MRLTAYQTALLILRAREAYEDEAGRALSRFRLSRKTMRRLSGRERNIREAFVDEVKEELIEFGWALFPVGDQFALLRLDRVDTWQRIAAARIAAEVRQAVRNPDEFDWGALEERFAPQEDEESDD